MYFQYRMGLTNGFTNFETTVLTSNVVPEETSGDPEGVSPDFLAKSLANPDKIFKKNAKNFFFENFVWICQ